MNNHTVAMRPTSQRLSRRAARLRDDSLLDRRTERYSRQGRKTNRRDAIRESIATGS